MDATDATHNALAEQAFRSIFVNYWPNYVGLERVEDWLSSIRSQQLALRHNGKPENATPILVLAENGSGRSIGLSYGMHFRDSNAMMGIFSAVAPDVLHCGIGRKIFDGRLEEGRRLAQRVTGRDLRGLFIETMNPARAVNEYGQPEVREGMYATDRKKVFQKLDCHDLPLRYSQPFTYLLPGEWANAADHDPETGAFTSYDLMMRPCGNAPLVPLIDDFRRSLAATMRPVDAQPGASAEERLRIRRMQKLSDRASAKLADRLITSLEPADDQATGQPPAPASWMSRKLKENKADQDRSLR